MLIGLAAFLVLYFSVYYLLSRCLLGHGLQRVTDPAGRKIEIIGRLILVAIALPTLYFLYFVSERLTFAGTFCFFIVYFAAQIGLQAWIEWKFLKGSKQYVVSLIMLVLAVLGMVVFGVIFFV
ncbi:DUF4181 domain-containing protein [Saccharibacillus kuerlensis]|uniref:DUF4181 domain-containing protein n=1 Tax=Saccharibacillus kuerlensis TaxID=459527 RepID=A0ABQ2L545_9BACL|nr:DUF4181 domain-containing protein [Saccharibacillus kuerlensis]GGO03860.1 hypothetical protein GCM10010969_28480 [Saccharibacillus kuerlensis]